MDTSSIIDFIKTKYPKVVFEPFKFANRGALAFVISDRNLVIGFVNPNGTLCKLIQPVNIDLLSSDSMRQIIEKIPTVRGFTSEDQKRLMKMFTSQSPVVTTVGQEASDQIIVELQEQIKRSDISQSEMRTIIQDLERQRLELSSKLSDLTSEHSSLTSERDSLTGKLSDLAKERDVLADTNTKLTEQISNLQQNIAKTSGEAISSLTEQLSTLTSERDTLSSRVSSMNNEKSNFEAQILGLTKNISELDERIAKLRSEGDAIKSERDTSSSRVSSLTSENTDLGNRVTELTSKLSSLEKERDLVKGDRTELESQIKRLTSERESLNTKVTELMNKIVDLGADSKASHERSVAEAQEYKALYDSRSNEIVLIKQQYENKIATITAQYDEVVKQLDQCRKQIVDQNDAILKGIEEYKEKMKDFVSSKDLKIEDLEAIRKRDLAQIAELQKQLEGLLQSERDGLQKLQTQSDLVSDYEKRLSERGQAVLDLEGAVERIQDKLTDVQEELKQSELQRNLIQGYKDRCKDKVLAEKAQIIQAIKEYNTKWLDWAERSEIDTTEYKRKLLQEFEVVKQNLQSVLDSEIDKSEMSKREILLLKQNISDVEASLKKTINDQLAELSVKDDLLKQKQAELQAKDAELQAKDTELQAKDAELRTSQTEIESRDERLRSTEERLGVLDARCGEGSDYDKMSGEIQRLREQNRRIPELQRELLEVKRLLEQNRNTGIETNLDYDNCYSIITNFASLNNIFFRKQEIMKKLDNIIKNNLGSFTNLSDDMKATVKADFERVQTEIMNHIKFLNLSDYISSPNFEYLKSRSTRSRVPESYCKDLSNLLEYWNVNKGQYRDQDTRLTNIYEDLAGAVRIYIRVKPLIGTERTESTIRLQTVENKKTKSLAVDCSDVSETKYKTPETFGEFYGIFEEDYNNLDVYTGQRGTPVSNNLKVNIDDIIESSDTISPGLYSTFKQVEDGYSIVIFGYGLSGSGKTYTLLGSKGNPGVLHYGLANLQNVKNIRLKNLFEQYVYKVNFNNRQVSGRIHHLIGKISQLNEVSKDETSEFQRVIPSYMDIKALRVEDLYALTDIIEQYRIERGRIKSTPNNPTSSRSHLYSVFEIEFTGGKTGFITIVDTAGRESPLDIFNTFIETTTTLPSVMAPPPVGGPVNIEKNMKSEHKLTYKPDQVFDILNEGFYINETINHLVYYFNLKNGKTISTPKQGVDKRFNVVYKVPNYFVQPQEEQSKIDGSNNSLMIPILKFLDNLSTRSKTSDWRPTKFITICSVRQESKYCDQTMETMQFAQNVKSS